jgi:hypothetical protein
MGSEKSGTLQKLVAGQPQPDPKKKKKGLPLSENPHVHPQRTNR